ncbi:RidA family protein [soil metagenome]|nr:RidA family protein [Trueperaceae bacterium]
MDRTVVSTDTAPAAIGPYSQAVRVGELLFTSGQIPLTPDGTLVTGDVQVQAKQVMENLGAVLAAGGSGFEHVIKCTVFLADMDDFATVNGVYGAYFGETPPARSAVQVARLPRDVRIEIEAVALVVTP